MPQNIDTGSLFRILLIHFIFFMIIHSLSNIKYKGKITLPKLWPYAVALIYAVCIYIFSFHFRDFFIIPFLFTGSILINSFLGVNSSRLVKMILSQIFHVILLTIVWLLLLGIDLITGTIDHILFKTIFKNIVSLFQDQKVLVIMLGYIIIIFPSGMIIGMLTEQFRRQLPVNKSRGLENAGLWIGCLERILVYSFVITNNLTAIALLVTAKSVFRFGEIKEQENRKEAEYILIGSILSIGIAMLCGYISRSFL